MSGSWADDFQRGRISTKKEVDETCPFPGSRGNVVQRGHKSSRKGDWMWRRRRESRYSSKSVVGIAPMSEGTDGALLLSGLSLLQLQLLAYYLLACLPACLPSSSSFSALSHTRPTLLEIGPGLWMFYLFYLRTVIATLALGRVVFWSQDSTWLWLVESDRVRTTDGTIRSVSLSVKKLRRKWPC